MRAAERASEDARREIERLERALAAERKGRLEAERELEQAEADSLDGAFCPRCAAYVARGEWASQEQDDFELVYHEACGFHPEDGLAKARSVFGYRALD